MERKLREELNALSKQVFGTSSRWKKIVDRGSPDAYDEDQTKVVPNALTGKLEQKTFKKRHQVLRRYTVEQIKEVMETILKKNTTTQEAVIEQAALEGAHLSATEARKDELRASARETANETK